MYRYSVDNAVTYTSEDLVQFRESPFACWMERLTLENPDHGIPPDLGSQAPKNLMLRQDELADTLRAEGKQVSLIDWDSEESIRRNATLEAMRQGTDFIVNGQLALGPLSGSANLLMRTSGYSELGSFLYIPCDTQAKTTINSAFRLCFLADLLHSLQGQLPPQMLIIRGGSDLVPLNTEDHIYHYLAVKQRFMSAMREFRKHRMPDPSESSQFGRWSECANEVMKQRAMQQAPDVESDSGEEDMELPVSVSASATEPVVAQPEQEQAVVYQNPIEARLATSRGIRVEGTLADQARSLPPVAEAAPPAPSITAPAPQRHTISTGNEADAGVESPQRPSRRAIDATLENLSFIGSHSEEQGFAYREPEAASFEPPKPESEPVPPAAPEVKTHPLDSVGYSDPDEAVIDRDDVVASSVQAAIPETEESGFAIDSFDDSDYRLPGEPPEFDVPAAEPVSEESEPPPFGNSLDTAGNDRKR